MAILLVPLRILLAFAGLVAGYWAGAILEKKWLLNSTMGDTISVISALHYAGSGLDDYLDSDDNLDNFFDLVSNTSDEETSYSEDAALGS
jgi:hypothetical protein